MKVEQLPLVNYPYVAEVEFLKEVRNVNNKAQKKPFKNGRVTSPFYILIKIREIEGSGTLAIRFYGKRSGKGDAVQMEERTFQFGEDNKYYEYIIFFDRIDGLAAGVYRYAILFRGKLLFEDGLRVHEKSNPVGLCDVGRMENEGPGAATRDLHVTCNM